MSSVLGAVITYETQNAKLRCEWLGLQLFYIQNEAAGRPHELGAMQHPANEALGGAVQAHR